MHDKKLNFEISLWCFRSWKKHLCKGENKKPDCFGEASDQVYKKSNCYVAEHTFFIQHSYEKRIEPSQEEGKA